MPLRHLLFNRRNEAAHKVPRSHPVLSLDSVRYFDLENEFPNHTWPQNASHQTYLQSQGANVAELTTSEHPMLFNTYAADSASRYVKTQDYRHQTGHSVYPTSSSPHTDFTDPEAASVYQGSIHSSLSSSSCLDMILDEDYDSLDSLSRKSSLVSTNTTDGEQEMLCPLLIGQIGECSPERCGINSPCLQYIHELSLPVGNHAPPTDQSLNIAATSYSLPSNPPYLTNPEHIQRGASPSPNTDDRMQQPDKVSYTDATSSSKEEPSSSRNNKRARARQSHSLVERKYRENLNARLLELNSVLRAAESSRSKARGTPHTLAYSQGFENQGEDDTGDEKMLRVKKQDVLVEAISYVHRSEAEISNMSDQIRQLLERIHMLEGWIGRASQGTPPI